MNKTFSIDTLAGGAVKERLSQAIQEVMENIADPNTPWKDKRKVTLEITLSTKEDREMIDFDVIAKTKLAPRTPVHTTFIMDRNLDGEIFASEYKKQLPGQTAIKVINETGEIVTTGETKDEPNEVKGLQLVK